MLHSLIIIHTLLSMQEDDDDATLLNLHAVLAGSADSDALGLLLLKKGDAPYPQPGRVHMSWSVLEALGREDSLYRFR